MSKYILGCFFLVVLASCSYETRPNWNKRNTTEIIEKFAWLPTDCPDGKSYWFKTLIMKRYWEVAPHWVSADVVEYDVCIKIK